MLRSDLHAVWWFAMFPRRLWLNADRLTSAEPSRYCVRLMKNGVLEDAWGSP